MAEVFLKQIRVREFFQDFDRLRKGTVTEDKVKRKRFECAVSSSLYYSLVQFRSALAMLNIYMVEKEIEDLLQRYRTSDGLINYDSFCRNIEQQFLQPQIGKEILYSTKSQAIYSEEEQAVVNEALQFIRDTIRTKRILLKQSFQDFDRTKSSHITVEQFTRALTKLGIVMTGSVYQILARKYVDNTSSKEINYMKFCADVDDVQEYLQTLEQKPQKGSSFVFKDIIDDVRNLDILSTMYVSKKLPTDFTKFDVEKKIQAQVVMKQLRIQEFFKDFDPLRKGVCTEGQFKRVLHISGLQLNEEEVNQVCMLYQDASGLIKYKQFCERIDEIFTKKGIEKDPLFRVSAIDNNTTLPARRYFLGLSEEESQRLGDLLRQYYQVMQSKRVLIKPHFQDFDKTKQGYVSKNQFVRILNQFGLFPNMENLNLLLKKYIDKGNLDEVNYYEFIRDIDYYDNDSVRISKEHAEAFKVAPPRPVVKDLSSSIAHLSEGQLNSELESILNKLRRKIKEQRIRVFEFLRDFDKLRSGFITEPQFRLGLNMAKLPLTNEEFAVLVKAFRLEGKENQIRWRDFCDRLDEIFTVKGLERNPAFEFVPINLDKTLVRHALSPQETEYAEACKARFRDYCKATRLDVKQFFMDWDKLGRNKVTPKQFRQVLTTVKFAMSDEEVAAICRMYASEDDSGDVRYVNFINDTNPFVGEAAAAVAQKNDGKNGSVSGLQTSSVFFKNIFTDPKLLVDKIRADALLNRLRFSEYFKDFDPLRKGIIPANKFRGVLSKMKLDFDFNEDVLNTLENMYRAPDEPTKVNYQRFCDDVEVVFTQPELEKNPLGRPENFTLPAFLDPKDQLSEAEEAKVHKVLLRLGEAVWKQRILIKPYFQDKDKAKSGKIACTRFRSVLDFCKLPISEEEYQLLCKRFSYQGVEFNYIEFDDVLNQYAQHFSAQNVCRSIDYFEYERKYI
eukprot:TRINITY_DN1811_c0_g2_i3.p1 TRINITY_DN1811_c0_g2~~TRINITY_DN1811_c0_g2_i3.p1  ORF type:complete len:956 (-),score=361.13 TRINITY_DN1811_c0_g2_i3:227-3094(-)